MSKPRISQTQAWKDLQDHFEQTASQHMRDLFAADATRAERFSLRLGPLLLDYSKNRITAETLSLLISLALMVLGGGQLSIEARLAQRRR